MGARYLVSDQWSEIFDPTPGTWLARFVFDDDAGRIVAMQLQKTVATPWMDATPDEIRHVEDGLLGPNSAALNDPGPWGLRVADEAPDWAREQMEDFERSFPTPR